MISGEVRRFDNVFIRMTNATPEFITDDSQHQYRVLHQDERGLVNHRDSNGKDCAICFSRISKAQSQLAETQATIAETQRQIAETENNRSNAILNLTEIIRNQQSHQEEETSNDEDQKQIYFYD
jgi:hypothetical protein